MMLRRRLLGLARQAPVPLALTVALALAATACAVGQGLLVAEMIRRVFAGARVAELTAPALGVLALVAGRALLLWARDVAAYRTAACVKARLRARLFAKLLELGPGHPTRRRTGDVQAVLADGVEALQAYVGFYIPQAVVAIVAPAALVVVLAVVDPVAGLVVAAGVLVVPLARPLFSRLLGDRGRRHWDAYTVLAARMLDALQGMPTLKMLGATGRHGEALRADTVALYRATVGNLAASLGVYSVVTLALGVGSALAVAVAALRFAGGALDAAGVLIVLLLAAECFRPLIELQNYWHEGFYGIAASSGIFALLDAEPAVHDRGRLPAEVVPRPPAVAFEDVTLRYPGAARPALDAVTLHAPPGRTLAIVGRSGAGKTTLVSLLLRFFDPDGGRVLVGGIDLRDLTLAASRSLVAVVSQDVHLFHGSVADNLRLAKPDATDAELVRAAQAARAHGFVSALPQGYATVLGERGATLSGGERQRIAIARALLSDAPVLVLDEATASVDVESEAAIQAALAELVAGRTTLVIAHRLSTVASADALVVLDGGRVVEAGAPADLLERDGPYARLVAAQRAGAGAR